MRTAMISTPKRIALTLAAAVAAATLVGVTPAHAQMLCHVQQDTWVYSAPGRTALYLVPAGGGFYLDYWWNAGGWAAGHGVGQADGFIRGLSC
ncbi:hypothetical protein [Streptosporangium sp. NPDC020145]|uniref:hypothetical protein n=1 Tax=Streptosporangium sp. NPDC020145 TaxID=3154694 RepID=UPI003431BC41